MNNTRNYTQALMPSIAAEARERARVVSDIKAQTANMLHAFGRERTAMVKALKSELATDRTSRSNKLLAIRQHTSTMRDGFRQEHRSMRRTLRKNLKESTQAVINYVSALRVEVAKERASFSNMFSQMSKVQHAELVKDCHSRSGTVENLIKGFHATRTAMAQQLANMLAQSTQGIRAQVLDLRCSVVPMLRSGTALNLPMQTSALQGRANLQNKSTAPPFSGPASDSKPKFDNPPVVTQKTKAASADADWHNEGAQGKSKKK